MPELVSFRRGSTELLYPLGPGSVTLGKDPGNEVVI
jgi:hypothetical protein